MRKLKHVVILAGSLAIVGCALFQCGTVRGAVAAIVDHARGRPAIYNLGCTNMWPRDPQEWRTRELFERDYRISFITIGGIAPSDDAVAFAEAYDVVSYRLLRMRHGRFDEDVAQRAATDVYQHEVEMSGCQWSARELLMAGNRVISISGQEEVLKQLAAGGRRAVRLRGSMVDIRGSKWRSQGYPQLVVEEVTWVGEACSRKNGA